MTKQKVSELPKEEKEALIAEAKKVGLTGVFESFNVSTLKTRIKEKKQDIEEISEENEEVKEFFEYETDELPESAEENSEEDSDEDEEADPEEDDENESHLTEDQREANHKERERLEAQKSSRIKDIENLKEKNIVLEKEAVKFENLASTIDTEPFTELKTLVIETIKTYADRSDVKECKKKIKNLETITSMETLLKDCQDLATENRQNIKANENEIKCIEEKIEELDYQLDNFQQKLINT